MKKFLSYLAIVVLLTLTFSCNDDLTVVEPTFSPDGGDYGNDQTVTITCSTPDATIKYTIDGTTPSSTNGIEIASGTTFTLSEPATVKAIGYKSRYIDSTIKSAIFSLQVEEPTFSPDGGDIKIDQEIAISCSTADSIIY